MAGYKDQTVVIFDVGKSAGDGEIENGSNFYEQEKECVQKYLLKKLFTKPKDEISLFLMGTTVTNNRLSKSLGGYDHISSGFPMAKINWNMLNYLKNAIDPPHESIEGDWLRAILVAVDYLQYSKSPKSNLKIILYTTLPSELDTDEDTINMIISKLNATKIKLIVITIKSKCTASEAVGETQNRRKNNSNILKILEQSDAILCDIKDATDRLKYFEQKNCNRVPWNCDLQIGSDLIIKISAFVYVKDEKQIGSWKGCKANGSRCEVRTEHTDKDSGSEVAVATVNTETVSESPTIPIASTSAIDVNQQTVQPAREMITGFQYGSHKIPCEQPELMKYDSGIKSLRCKGFVDQSCISWNHLAGTGIWAVVAQKKSVTSQNMITALVAAMRDTNSAMIVRYVNRIRAPTKMMVLFPNNRNNKHQKHNSLLMHELFYRENYVLSKFPRLKMRKRKPTDEQYEAVGMLIDAMDLMSGKEIRAEDEEGDVEILYNDEAFKKLIQPHVQYTYRALANKALHSDEKLLPLDEDLLEMLKPPQKLQIQSKQHLEKIKNLFRPKTVEKMKKSNKVSKPVPTSGNSNIGKVGLNTPVKDFLDLIRRGVSSYSTLATQLGTIIVEMALSTVISREKLLKAISTYRNEAKTLGPLKYNEWIVGFKELLLEKNKVNIWTEFIRAEQFGLITSRESELSTVTEKEAVKFYTDESISPKKTKQLTIDDIEYFDDLADNL